MFGITRAEACWLIGSFGREGERKLGRWLVMMQVTFVAQDGTGVRGSRMGARRRLVATRAVLIDGFCL